MDNVMVVWNWVSAHWLELTALVSTVVALTPTEKDDHVWDRIKNVLNKWKPVK